MKKLYYVTAIGIITLTAITVSATYLITNTRTIERPIIAPARVFDINKDDLLTYTNKLRTEKLPGKALVADAALEQTAAAKCADMVEKNYFDHRLWRDLVAPLHRVYTSENIAQGFYTSREVVKGWEESLSHYEAIINTHYTRVGFGICSQDDRRIVVQHFSS